MNGRTTSGKVGLYFGSFNPIHLGHLVIANHMVNRADIDEVWMVVTPTSPFKLDEEMIPEEQRLQMVRLAVAENSRIYASDVEFYLPRPNYTANTLKHLREDYPQIEFSVIIGEDNFENLHRWQEHEEIISNHRILVYPRRVSSPNIPPPEAPNAGESPTVSEDQVVVFTQAPMIAISSSYIRYAILKKQDIQYLLPDPVISYIGNNHLYEKSQS
ncbi:MAG: nicotinic acid mononucleotide adenylyltransferase [Crocinitomicaceae bacterium]|nr:nicotinic acid mononucleotide adenylyltransferase [Crocinitomicaceae bacterium]|tara:strand:- start:7139 stop:7783 length:645 start_codon:yes stop_codon:yes gene_type:complete